MGCAPSSGSLRALAHTSVRLPGTAKEPHQDPDLSWPRQKCHFTPGSFLLPLRGLWLGMRAADPTDSTVSKREPGKLTHGTPRHPDKGFFVFLQGSRPRFWGKKEAEVGRGNRSTNVGRGALIRGVSRDGDQGDQGMDIKPLAQTAPSSLLTPSTPKISQSTQPLSSALMWQGQNDFPFPPNFPHFCQTEFHLSWPGHLKCCC